MITLPVFAKPDQRATQHGRGLERANSRPAGGVRRIGRRRFRLLWACGVPLLLLACALPARALTDAEEISLGAEVNPRIESLFGGMLPEQDPLSRRVQRVGRTLARLSTRHLPISYRVLDNDQVLNAFTIPGGEILITRRLALLAKTDAELAAILAHETAHVERHHIADRYDKLQAAQKQAGTFSQGLLGNMVRHDKGSAVALAASLVFVLTHQEYSREKESEADAYGARMLSRAGYDPRSLIVMLQRMSSQTQKSRESGFHLATHPEAVVRCADLQALIAREKLIEVANQNHRPRSARRHGYRSKRRRAHR